MMGRRRAEGMTRTRKFLLIIFAATLLTKVVSWLQPPPPTTTVSPKLFTLSLQGHEVVGFANGKPGNLPNFDPADQTWKIGGKEISDLFPLIGGYPPDRYRYFPYLLVELPWISTASDYRAMVEALAKQGVCNVGVYSPIPAGRNHEMGFDGKPWPPADEVSIYRIETVRLLNGTYLSCIDRMVEPLG